MVILSQLKALFHAASQTLWAELESSQVPGNNLHNYLLARCFLLPKPSLVSPHYTSCAFSVETTIEYALWGRTAYNFPTPLS